MGLKTILNILAVVFAVGMTTGTAFAAANAFFMQTASAAL